MAYINVCVTFMQVVQETSSEHETTYKNLLTKLPDGPEVLESAYESITKLVKDVDGYVNVSILEQKCYMDSSTVFSMVWQTERYTFVKMPMIIQTFQYNLLISMIFNARCNDLLSGIYKQNPFQG